jgi:hypothetical protein
MLACKVLCRVGITASAGRQLAAHGQAARIGGLQGRLKIPAMIVRAWRRRVTSTRPCRPGRRPLGLRAAPTRAVANILHSRKFSTTLGDHRPSLTVRNQATRIPSFGRLGGIERLEEIFLNAA